MPINGLHRIVGRLRRVALRQDGAGLSDAELLDCYIKQRDEASFKVLLNRHGPMVLGVCRRILRNEADAEDAFQATFLVLVRKAASVRPRSMVSNWLYGVAHNTALKAKAMNRKRLLKEREAGTMPKPHVDAEVLQQVQTLVDRELSHLPDKYRVPIVLCDLEGRTIKEAAGRLDWPQGTLATRLTRGRALLARRLSRHGLTLSAGALAAMLAQGVGQACVRAPLLTATIKTATVFAAGPVAAAGAMSARAVVLAEGVLKLMLVSKLKIVGVFLLLATVIGLGAGVPSVSVLAGNQTETKIPKSGQGSRKPPAPNETLVVSDADGVIIELPARVRDTVKARTILARLGDVSETALLMRDETSLQVARAEVKFAAASLAKARNAAEAAKQAFFKDRLISERAYKGELLTCEKWEAEVERKKARVLVAIAELNANRERLTKHAVRSPLSGTITRVFKKRGDTVKKGDPLVQVSMGLPATGPKDSPKQATDADQLFRVLNLRFDSKDVRLPNLTLKEFLGLLNEKIAAKGGKLRVLVDPKAFKKENPAGPTIHDIYDHTVVFPTAESPKVSVHFVLRAVLNQLPVGAPQQIRRGDVLEISPSGEPALVFHDGAIWITTRSAVSSSRQELPRKR